MSGDWVAGFFVAIIAIWILVFLLCLKWIRKVAVRNHRSSSGFGWLFFISPVIAWAILLTIDKRE